MELGTWSELKHLLGRSHTQQAKEKCRQGFKLNCVDAAAALLDIKCRYTYNCRNIGTYNKYLLTADEGKDDKTAANKCLRPFGYLQFASQLVR